MRIVKNVCRIKNSLWFPLETYFIRTFAFQVHSYNLFLFTACDLVHARRPSPIHRFLTHTVTGSCARAHTHTHTHFSLAFGTPCSLGLGSCECCWSDLAPVNPILGQVIPWLLRRQWFRNFWCAQTSYRRVTFPRTSCDSRRFSGPVSKMEKG